MQADVCFCAGFAEDASSPGRLMRSVDRRIQSSTRSQRDFLRLSETRSSNEFESSSCSAVELGEIKVRPESLSLCRARLLFLRVF